MNNLGKQVRDKVTGFEGIITGKTYYLYGCACYGVTPLAKDGKTNDTCWFDEGRIEVIGDGVEPETVKVEEPGGMDEKCPNNIYK